MNNLKKKKEIIIFSGFNTRAVIAFLRTLTELKINFSIIAVSDDDLIFDTIYKSKVLAVRKSYPLDLKDLIESIEKVKSIRNIDEYLIAPSTEALIRFILEHRDIFEGLNCIVPLISKDLYEKISNKFSFGKLCQKYSILVPDEYSEISDNIFPLVAKPITYFSSRTREILSPILLHDSSDLNNFLNKFNKEDFYYQEYIRGKSLYLLYYFHRNGKVYKFSQENLIQQPGGKSIVAAVSSNFHHSEESKKYEQLFKSINYFGIVMVEVRQDGIKNYMIEANPRFWGPSQLFVDANMNFFKLFLHDFGFIDKLPVLSENNSKIFKYFWYGGIMGTILNDHNLVYHNYSPNQMLEQFPSWISSDLYRRKDTLGIFRRETKF